MKNVKFNKKLLSMLTAGVLFATPVAANAETKSQNGYNDHEFTLVVQDKEIKPLTMVEFYNGVKEAYDYLTKFINYDNLQGDLQSLYYLVNREYIPDEVEQELISSGIVFETSFTEQKYENMMRAYNLINIIADYNQSVVRKTDTLGEMIDVCMICYNDKDRELVHNMHNNYFNAYKNGRYDNEDFRLVFKQLTTLNAYEKEGNAAELSVGARWLAENSIGGAVMQLLRDDMQEDYSRSELDRYFVASELNKGQWILREDVSLDLNCMTELEKEVFEFGELWHFVYTTVNNDLIKSFEKDCTKSK